MLEGIPHRNRCNKLGPVLGRPLTDVPILCHHANAGTLRRIDCGSSGWAGKLEREM
jgi:hypothetical protein